MSEEDNTKSHKNKSAIRSTIWMHKLCLKIRDILIKHNGECHKLSDMTTNYIFQFVQKLKSVFLITRQIKWALFIMYNCVQLIKFIW